MTPEAIAAVQRSAASARGNPEFGRTFYRLLFARAPETESMFSASVDDQARKFTDQLDALVRALVDFERFAGEAQALGARHRGYGVFARHYPIVREALVDALGEVLDGGLDPATARAWRAAFDLVAEEMQYGAAQV